MKPSVSHQPPHTDHPEMLAAGLDGVVSEGVDSEPDERIVYPHGQAVEVIPSGNYPAVGDPYLAPPVTPAAQPARVRAEDGGIEIISASPDRSFGQRRRPKNRRPLGALNLLGIFFVGQVVLGLMFFAIFGATIRSWLQEGAVIPDGVTAEEALVLRDEVNEASSDFAKLGSDLEQVKKRIAINPGDAWKQLEVLEARNLLTMLADDAITNGKRGAFDELVLLAGDASAARQLRDGAVAEILRVKQFYASGTRLGSYTLPVSTLYPSLKTEKEEALDTAELLKLLGDQEKSWKVRTRAAYLLGSRRKLAVCEALVRAAREDPNLDVVKECVFTFEENTGYRAKGLFEIEALVSWWTVYEARVGVTSANAQDPS